MIEQAKFFVEANSFEMMKLYEENKTNKLIDWKHIHTGFSQVIGEIGGMPINVSYSFAVIYDQVVCFYDVVSQCSDSDVVETHLKKNYPVKYDEGRRCAITDAMNFHLALHACQELKRLDFVTCAQGCQSREY